MFRAIDNFFLRIEKDLFSVPALGEVDTTDESKIIAELNKAFNAKLEEFKENGNTLKNRNDYFSCGKPMSLLANCGLNLKHEIILTQSVLRKAIGLKVGKQDEAHNFKITDFEGFPEKIQFPSMVITGNTSGSRLIFAELGSLRNRKSLAVLSINQQNEKRIFTDIVSVYSKPSYAAENLIREAKLKNHIWLDSDKKEKGHLPVAGRLQLPPSIVNNLEGTKLAPKIDKDKVFNQKNLLSKLVLPENCQTTRDCAVQIYECIAGIDLLRMMNRNYTNVQKRVFALAARYRQLAKAEGVAYDWKTAMQKYLDEPDQPVNGLDTELIEEIASIPDGKTEAVKESKQNKEAKPLKMKVEPSQKIIRFKKEDIQEEGGKVVSIIPKATEEKTEPAKPESNEIQPEPEAQKFDFIYEVSHGGGYYIKTFLRLPVSASVKDVTDSSIPGLRNYSATEKGLKDLQAKFTSAYGDKHRLSSKDLNNPICRAEVERIKGQSGQIREVEKAQKTLFGVDDINEQFNKELDLLIAGKLPKNHVFYLGDMSDIFNQIGIKILPIEMQSTRLSKKSNQNNHVFDLLDLRNLPDKLNRPLMVFKSKTVEGSLVVLTELMSNNINFVVAIELGRTITKWQKGEVLINDIRSIYPKDTITDVLNWIEKGNLLLWVDKQKSLDLLVRWRSNYAKATQQIKRCTKILQNFKNPETSPQNVVKNNFGLAPLGSIKKAKTQRLRGDIGRFLGEFDRVNYSIVLRGDKGAGKSRLLFQFVNAFAEKKLRCALLSIEMSPESSVIHRYTNEYIDIANRPGIQITGESQDYESLSAICKMFDVVAIDSWTKLKNVSQDDFDRLQKENPATIIISIFQSTTGKVTRGGNKPEFDAGTVIHVHEGGVAECEKNRYSGDNLKYSVFDQKIIEEPKEVKSE